MVMICKLELGQHPSREHVVAQRLSQVSVSGQVHGVQLSQSTFKKPKHRNNTAETRQKKLQTGGHRPEWFLICSGRVSKPRCAWLSCNTSALILAPLEQRAHEANSAVISTSGLPEKAVTNSHDKQSFTFANGGVLLAPRQHEEESVGLD